VNLRAEIAELASGLRSAEETLRLAGRTREADAARRLLVAHDRRRQDEREADAAARQRGLFDPIAPPPPRPYVRSDTSIEAASSAAVVSNRAKILRALRNKPATDDELEVLLEMSHQSVSAARRGLVREGKVRESGRHRLTRSGRRAIVWEKT